jgi:hypothetical protein
MPNVSSPLPHVSLFQVLLVSYLQMIFLPCRCSYLALEIYVLLLLCLFVYVNYRLSHHLLHAEMPSFLFWHLLC